MSESAACSKSTLIRPGSTRDSLHDVRRRDPLAIETMGRFATRRLLPLLVIPASCSEVAPEASLPNIVLIVADDLGYSDLGCTGSADIRTPHIDSLAADGVLFTSAYVSASVCSPSRAGMLTGRYQQRFGHEDNLGPTAFLDSMTGLPVGEKTIGDLLKASGYVTGIVGKWHLGVEPHFHPFERGFDEFYGFLQGGHDYFSNLANGPLVDGTTCVDVPEYLTRALTTRAVEFVEGHHDRPFFLYLSYNAVHTPYQAPEEDLDRVQAEGDEERRIYAAMVEVMDAGVGSLLEKLEEHGLAENTLVVFLSDNGGVVRKDSPARNGSFRGGKSTLFEGGIRVPLIMKYPARYPSGTRFDDPVTALDLLPTFGGLSAASHVWPVTLDGVDLTPFVAGEARERPHDVLLWRRLDDFAIRRGDHKLVRQGQGPPKLFDLALDPQESLDIASDNAELVRQLLERYEQWDDQLAEPLWLKAEQLERKEKGIGRREPHPTAWLDGFERIELESFGRESRRASDSGGKQ